MDKISEKEFNELGPEVKTEIEASLDEDKIANLLKKMENPLQAQKELAVQIKISLEKRMKEEMEKNGHFSENTRRWIDTYNSILEKLQKSIHGDKSVNLHLVKVSHSDISNKIRESVITLETKKEKKKGDE